MKRILSTLCAIGLGTGLVLVSSALAYRSYQESTASSRRGLLASDIVQKYGEMIARQNLKNENFSRLRAELWKTAWSGDDHHPILCSWVVTAVFAGKSPTWILNSLKKSIEALSFEPHPHPHKDARAVSLAYLELRGSLGALENWAKWQAEKNSKSGAQLWSDAQISYFQATGYQKMNRDLTAAILYLRASEDLRNFIRANPDSTRLPEALFLLGDSYFGLRSFMPRGLRSERILQLVPEFYPDSMWAARASAVWLTGRANGP